MTTIGASRRSERPMSVTGASPDLPGSTPGTCTISDDPGENPSRRFHGAGCVGTPAADVGSTADVNATRRPVGDDASARVNQSFGNGSRHAVGSMGSQPRSAGTAAATAAGTAAVPPVAAATGGTERAAARAASAATIAAGTGRRRCTDGSPPQRCQGRVR